MRLRNRQTGIVGELHYEPDKEYHFTVATEDPADMAIYRTLAELNEKWEDYAPQEPLIKDEKIRKAVRAWAEANRTKYVWVSTALKGIYITQDFEHLQLTEYKQSIAFECEADFKSGTYTIAELCGEEE